MKKYISLLVLIFSIFYHSNLIAQENYTFTINNKNYELVKYNKTWKDAAFAAYSSGGTLAEINSAEEQDSIYFYLQQAEIDLSLNTAPDGGNASYIWIGGNDLAEEGKWIWDGTNDGYGINFWQGNFLGEPVDSSYSNWGNEPDDFSNQDAIGLAITNWPRGTAGQWNDISVGNKLFYLIEYDNSIIKINSLDYSHRNRFLKTEIKFPDGLDSLQVIINNEWFSSILNPKNSDSLITIDYMVQQTQYLKFRILGFKDGIISSSPEHSIIVYTFGEPLNSYYSDFENNPVNDFIGDYFEFKKEFGFPNIAVHSLHNYNENQNMILALLRPVIVNNSSPFISYSDIALIEPSDSDAVFGDENYNDFVVLEASKDADNWLPLAPGYNSSYNSQWLDAYNSPTVYRNLFIRHRVDISNTFSAGDTILIRFRFFSNQFTTGWGWCLDSLQIQDFPLSTEENEISNLNFTLAQNYPNPFNPATIIRYSIPVAVPTGRQAALSSTPSGGQAGEAHQQTHVTLKIYDILGNEVTTLVNESQSAGSHEIQFNASGFSSGVYFYRLSISGDAGKRTKVRKMLLLK